MNPPMAKTGNRVGKENPFPGLRPFELDETEYFFGRDAETNDLLSRLRQTRFLAVLGESGAGKSSIVRAGLLAALEAGFMVDTAGSWRMAVLRPGEDPIARLAEALTRPEALGEPSVPAGEQKAIFQAMLHRGPHGLIEAVQEGQLPDACRLLVLVDQFEELFRFMRGTGGVGAHDSAQAFVKLLLEASAQRELPVYVVLTMRSEYLGQCAALPGLAEAISDGLYLVPQMTRAQLRETIEGPVSLAGGQITNRLVNRLLNDVRDDADQLPVLQHALMRLWSVGRRADAPATLDLDDFRKIAGPVRSLPVEAGGTPAQAASLPAPKDPEPVGWLAMALSAHADEAYGRMTLAQQPVARSLFRCLAERGETGLDTRRPTQLKVVAAVAGVEPAEVAAVVEVFRDPELSFLMPPLPVLLEPDTILDISHESLIRNWDRLKHWVQEEAESAAEYLRLEETAQRWKQGKAAYYRPPDLDSTLRWRETQRPTKAWAERYGANFELAMDFLQASEQQWREDQEQAETARNREKKLGRVWRLVWVGVMVLALVGGLAVRAFMALHQEQIAKREAVDERAAATAAREDARKYAVRLAVANGARLLEANDVSGAQLWFADALNREADDPALEEAHRRRLAIGMQLNPTLAQVWFSKAKLTHAEFSPDGSSIMTASEDGMVTVWTPGKDHPRWNKDGKARIVHAEFHPAGHLFVTVDTDGNARTWKTATGDSAPVPLEKAERVLHAAFSPQKNHDGLLTAGTRGARLWDVKAGPPRESHSFATDQTIRSASFSPDGKRVVFGGDFRGVTVHEVESGKEILSIVQNQADPVRQVVFSPDGKYIAAAFSVRFGSSGALIWDAQEGELVSKLSQFDRQISGLSFSPDSKWLLTIGEDSKPQVWRTDKQDPVFPGTRLTDDFRSVRAWNVVQRPFLDNVGMKSGSFSKDGRYLVIAATDNTARVGSVDSDFVPFSPLGHGSPVVRASFSPDGRWVLTASENSIRLWDLQKTILMNAPIKGARDVRLATLGPDGESVAFVNGDETVWICDLITGRRIVPHAFAADGIQFLRIMAGERLLTGDDKNWRVWSIKSGMTIGLFPRDEAGLPAPSFSADGGLAVRFGKKNGKGGIGEPVELWKVVPKPELIGELKGADAAAKAVFSPDGKLLVTLVPGKIMVWSAASGTVRQLLAYPAFQLTPDRFVDGNVGFSPDSNFLFVAGQDNTLYVWDMRDGTKLAEIKNSARVIGAAFVQKSSRLAIAADDKTARIWDIATGQPVTGVVRFPSRVFRVDFSSDGAYVAGVSEGTPASDQVQVWNAATSEPVTPPLAHPELIGDAHLSPDGKRLITIGSRQGSVRVWNLAPSNQKLNRTEYIGLAQLQSGQKISSDTGAAVRLATLDPGEFAKMWRAVQRALPRGHDFTGPQIAWHWQSALECVELGQWRAALPHLRALQKGEEKDLGSILLAGQGDLKRKLGLYDDALNDLKSAAHMPNADASLPWVIAATLREKSDALPSDKRMDGYKESLDQLKTVWNLPGDRWLARREFGKLADSYYLTAQEFLNQNETKRAVDLLRQMQIIPGASRRLADSQALLKKIGDKLYVEGHVAQAQLVLEQALRIHEQLAKDPKLTSVQIKARQETEMALNETLATIDEEIGSTEALLAARDHLQKALEINQRQANEDPTADGPQAKKSSLLLRLGRIGSRRGETSEAYKYFLNSAEINQTRRKSRPDDWRPQDNLSYSYRLLIPECLNLGKTKQADEFFNESLAICEALAKNQDASAQKYAAYRFADLGILKLIFMDDTLGSRRYFETAITLLQSLLKKSPDADIADIESVIATNHESLAFTCLELGDAKAARKHSEAEVEIRERILRKDPNSFVATHNLSYAYAWRGNVARNLNDREVTEESYAKLLELRERMVKTDPGNAKTKALLAEAYGEVGQAKMEFGDAVSGLNYIEKSAALRKELYEQARTDVVAKSKLAGAMDVLAWVNSRVGNSTRAGQCYKLLVDRRTELEAAEDKNVGKRSDLAAAFEQVGAWHLTTGEAKVALDYYAMSLKLRKPLVAEPKTSAARRALATLYRSLGDAHLEQYDTENARVYFQQALDLAQPLANDDPENLMRQIDLVSALSDLGRAELQADRFSAARQWFQDGLLILKKLNDQGKLVSRANQKLFMKAKRRWAVTEKGEQVLKDRAIAAKEPPDWAAELLIFRAAREAHEAKADKAKMDEALQTAEALRKLGPGDPSRLFDLARCYARMGRSVVMGRGRELPVSEQKAAASYFRRAMAALNQAVNAGYRDWGTLLYDSDLDIIRAEPSYAELVGQAPVQPFKTPLPDPEISLKDVPRKSILTLMNGSVQVIAELTRSDAKDTRQSGSFGQVYFVKFSAGKTYQIDMRSAVIDSYLRLEDDKRKELAFDDDSGGFPNARIVFRCLRDGTYRIIATTYKQETGRYTLSVQQK